MQGTLGTNQQQIVQVDELAALEVQLVDNGRVRQRLLALQPERHLRRRQSLLHF